MNTKVKICGIRSLKAVRVALDEGADFLGFNFVPTSKRYINPRDALRIIKLIRRKIKIVGVFQNADIDYINNMAANLGLDFVQLHGQENNDYINMVGIPVIKSITLKDQLSKIKTKYFILDRVNRGKGEMVSLTKAARLAIEFPIFYAGGLNSDNVGKIIRKVRPFAVDVAGGIETDGCQDLEKIKLFIKRAKGESI